MEPIKTIEEDGLRVRIYRDDYPDSPRNWDNMGTMVCFLQKYTLGDKHDFKDPEDLEHFLEATEAVHLPLYIYDHSGITMSTSSFSCPWDSGRVGSIFVEKHKVIEEHGSWDKRTKKKAEERLRREVKTYDTFLMGEVYGYIVDRPEPCDSCGHTSHEEIDSCWGLYGRDYAEEAALESMLAKTPA